MIVGTDAKGKIRQVKYQILAMAPSTQTEPPKALSVPAVQGSSSSSAWASTPQGGNEQSIGQELQLSDDQKQKVVVVVDDENRPIDALRHEELPAHAACE